MRMVVNAVKLLSFILLFLCWVSCGKNDFTSQYYRELDQILADSANMDVMTSELVNNGFHYEANEVTKNRDWDSFFGHLRESGIFDLKQIELRPVEEVLDSILLNSDIVMINENHFLSYQRDYFRKIALKAKDFGYDQVAIEALLDTTQQYLMDDTGVFLRAGYYTKDPYFSNMILELKSIGYEIISYEPSHYERSSPWSRDKLMAENILNKMNPSRKLLIYCGWSHAVNKPYWLRYNLSRDLPGKKITSINHTALFPESNSTIYNEVKALATGEFSRPCFLYFKNNPITTERGYEMEVIFAEDYAFGQNNQEKTSLIKKLDRYLPNPPCDRLFLYNKNTIAPNQEYVPIAIIRNRDNLQEAIFSLPINVSALSLYSYCKGQLKFLGNVNI